MVFKKEKNFLAPAYSLHSCISIDRIFPQHLLLHFDYDPAPYQVPVELDLSEMWGPKLDTVRCYLRSQSGLSIDQPFPPTAEGEAGSFASAVLSTVFHWPWQFSTSIQECCEEQCHTEHNQHNPAFLKSRKRLNKTNLLTNWLKKNCIILFPGL